MGQLVEPASQSASPVQTAPLPPSAAHVPALDGIRGLAILLVPFDHLFWANGHTGNRFLDFISIAMALRGGSLIQQLFSNSWLRFFGKYSYGLYVFHYSVSAALNRPSARSSTPASTTKASACSPEQSSAWWSRFSLPSPVTISMKSASSG